VVVRTFKLVRSEDVSGVSGVGAVADGVEFEDGQVVLSWNGRHHTLEIAPNIKAVIDIHGHEGKTTVAWEKTYEDGVNDGTVLAARTLL
jgi:hypothetical protein